MTIIDDLQKYLVAEIAADLGRKSLSPEEDLLEQRIIDSLGILKLVVYLEKTHDIKVMDEEVVPENFQSLASMARFVEQKRDGR